MHGAVRDQELALRVGRSRQAGRDRLAEGEVAATRRRHLVLVERGQHRLAHVRRERRGERALQRQEVGAARERALGRDRRHRVVSHRTTPPARAPVGDSVGPCALARDPDPDDALGEAQRALVGRRVHVAGRIQEDEVGALTHLDPAAIRKPEAIGGPCRQPSDRLVRRQQAVAQAEAAEEPGRAPRDPRMRLGPEDPVRAEQHQRVGCDPPNGLLGGVVQDHLHVELGLEQQLRDRLDGLAAALGEAHAVGHDPLRAECAEEVLPAGKAVLDVIRDPRHLRLVAQPRQGRRRAALLRPRGQQAREQGAAGAVGVLVEGDALGSLEPLEQRLDQPLVGERLQMRDVE